LKVNQVKNQTTHASITAIDTESHTKDNNEGTDDNTTTTPTTGGEVVDSNNQNTGSG
jgi:hypothetical protein